MVRFARRAQALFREREEPAWLQDAERFGEEPGPVGDVHRHVLRTSAIELLVLEREVLPSAHG